MLSCLFPLAHERYASLPILGELLEGLCEWLHVHGYPQDAIRRRVVAARSLDQSLRHRRIRSLKELTSADLLSLAPAPTTWTALTVGSLVRSLALYLEELGRLRTPSLTATEKRVADYRHYLEEVRGLAPSTAKKHLRTVTAFLRSLGYDARPERLREVGADDIRLFLTTAGRRLGRASMQAAAAALRAFLRYLAVERELPVGLDAHVDSPRLYREERLPRALSWKTVRRLLKVVDRSTPKGRRDYAMLLLIAAYGLRVSEVAALELDHVLWRSSKIQVPRPKLGTPLILPLIDEVASALLDYLRLDRQASECRRLFLRVRAPLGPIRPTAVNDVFNVWAKHADIHLAPGAGGPHCLRHSLAVHLLRRGATVKTIGDLLGHRSTESTCVYLRLQVDDLRDVALPLPTAPVQR